MREQHEITKRKITERIHIVKREEEKGKEREREREHHDEVTKNKLLIKLQNKMHVTQQIKLAWSGQRCLEDWQKFQRCIQVDLSNHELVDKIRKKLVKLDPNPNVIPFD